MQLRFVVVLVVLSVGCDRGASVKKPDCGAAVAALAKAKPGVTLTAEQLANMKTAIATRCSEDKWTDEAVSCFANATDETSQRDCSYKRLTQAQQDKLEVALRPLHDSALEGVMAKMTEFKNQMCKCNDSKCAQQVSDDMTKWSQEMSKSAEESPKMTEADLKRARELGEEMGRCMQVAIGTDPDNRGGTDQVDAAHTMAKMAEFKDRMCACKDATCAQQLSDDMTKWATAVGEVKNPPRMSEDETKKAAALGAAMGRCMQKAMSNK